MRNYWHSKKNNKSECYSKTTLCNYIIIDVHWRRILSFFLQSSKFLSLKLQSESLDNNNTDTDDNDDTAKTTDNSWLHLWFLSTLKNGFKCINWLRHCKVLMLNTTVISLHRKLCSLHNIWSTFVPNAQRTLWIFSPNLSPFTTCRYSSFWNKKRTFDFLLIPMWEQKTENLLHYEGR